MGPTVYANIKGSDELSHGAVWSEASLMAYSSNAFRQSIGTNKPGHN